MGLTPLHAPTPWYTPLHAEIIAVGTELANGSKLDTNSRWLSLELAGAGIPVTLHTTVADTLDEMLAVFRAAVERSDLVLVTGGLGPTLDDLTRQALAEIMHVELALHEPSLEFIKSLFASRGMVMPERNTIQAYFPRGTTPLTNPRGTAPGIWAEIPRAGKQSPCLVASLPGVPSEMKPMFAREVLPRLPNSGRVIKSARINCFGLGESATEEKLGALTARGRDPEVGITAHEATITLRIIAHGGTADECERKIAETSSTIRALLGDYVFGTEDDELADVVARLMEERGATLSTAEVGTGGMLAHYLTSAQGHESCYRGGIVAAAEQLSGQLAELDPSLFEHHGPISAEAASALAVACRARFDTDYALAVSGFPRYDIDRLKDAPAAAYIALAGNDFVQARKHVLIGDPGIARSRGAKAAINLLRLHLLGVL